ncbi:MAG: hypothetical protein JWN99_2431 [Ilumatobacteraceae bacterium]|nr:hypothetical protein [Ilumatobacteraceae bacterium]
MDAVARRKIDMKLLIASLIIASGVVLVVAGVRSSVTGKEQQDLPPELESILPVKDATQVPQQSNVFVDLITGYRAVLVIDNIELPVVSLDDAQGEVLAGGTIPNGATQLVLPPGAVFEPGNVTLTFTPGPDQAITKFDSGVHTVTVIYWKSLEGRQRSRSFTWNFYVV